MAETTINVNAPIDPNTPMRELNSTMNYLVAQTATGINLNKKISGQISSLSMNVGKVISTTNGVIREVALSNQKLDVFSNKLDTIDGSIKELIGVVKSGSGTEKTNRSIGNLSQRVTALVSRQDELNKTLQSYFNTNKKNEYEALEVKLEQRNDMLSESLKDMTETLVSIDKTLKGISEIGGGGGGGIGDLLSVGGAAAGFTALLSSPVVLGAIAAAALKVGDYAGGKIFDYGSEPDYEYDKLNRSKMNFSEKAEDNTARVVEDVLGILMPNSANEYRKTRIHNTAEYFANKEQDAANWDNLSFMQKMFSAPGRARDNLYSYIPFFGDDLANMGRQSRLTYETPRDDTEIPALPDVPLDKIENTNDMVLFPKTEEKKTPETQKKTTVAEAAVTKNSTMPYFPRVGSADIPLSSFNTRDVLEAQQAEIENKAKGMTSSDMLYEAADVIYKASTIRFEASNIQFLGALGAAGGGGLMGGSSRSGGPYNNGGGPGNTFNQGGGNGEVEPIGAARLTPEQKKAIDELEKTGKYVPGVNETSALSSLTDEQLAAMGISKSIAPGPGGQTEYTYDKEANKNADFLPKEARALLDTISAPGLEGADYNTVVGGSKFSDYGQHPGKVGVVTAQGPSTAAGRYQITGTTWKELQAKYPDLKDFSPENQDKAAWYLAQERYAKATGGRKLEEDLKSNDPNIIQGVSRALSGTWSSLEGGVHQGSGAGKFNKMFSENLEKGSNGPRGSLADQVGNAMPEKEKNTTSSASKDYEYLDNPNNAKLDGVDPRLMSVNNEAARRFEEANPNLDVEVYGPSSGVRHSGSTGNHGVQDHGYGGALDIRIKDKKTGKYLDNFQSGKDAPIYQQFHNFSKLAQEKYHPDMNMRTGLYFSSGDTALDSMHSDILGHKGMSGGSWEEGFTPEMMARFGIDPSQNMGMEEFRKMYGYDQEVKQAELETKTSKNAASVIRTDTLRQEEARVNDGKNEQRKRENDRITQSIQNREAAGPKNPKVEKKELRDVLRSHRNWYDDYWVSRV